MTLGGGQRGERVGRAVGCSAEDVVKPAGVLDGYHLYRVSLGSVFRPWHVVGVKGLWMRCDCLIGWCGLFCAHQAAVLKHMDAEQAKAEAEFRESLREVKELIASLRVVNARTTTIQARHRSRQPRRTFAPLPQPHVDIPLCQHGRLRHDAARDGDGGSSGSSGSSGSESAFMPHTRNDIDRRT